MNRSDLSQNERFSNLYPRADPGGVHVKVANNSTGGENPPQQRHKVSSLESGERMFDMFSREYVMTQSYVEEKQIKKAHILRDRQSGRYQPPRSILEVLSPNMKMAQTLAARTRFSPFVLLVFAGEVTKPGCLDVARTIHEVTCDPATHLDGAPDRPTYVPHPEGLKPGVGGISHLPQSLYNHDSASNVQVELWRRASQFVNGPPHARVEGAVPYQYRGYHNHDRIRVSPYSPQDLLMAVCRARQNLPVGESHTPLVVTTDSASANELSSPS
eukprot:GHVH01004368.1.p1 GENE.GHVH01004368.1~~GHVH01004368.1.p1  ORF type:complete len:282 (+),score=30.46 GHVH01004368.1:32-847(+)